MEEVTFLYDLCFELVSFAEFILICNNFV